MSSHSEQRRSGQDLLIPDWPELPEWAQARFSTSRAGNLAAHLPQCDLSAVEAARARLTLALQESLATSSTAITTPVQWLQQVHGIECIELPASEPNVGSVPVADASFTQRAGVVCAVLTADCLPILLCDVVNRRVAAVHAGWRGLLDGVIEASVVAAALQSAHLTAWIGPAIGACCFEIGPEVVEQIRAVFGAKAEPYLRPVAAEQPQDAPFSARSSRDSAVIRYRADLPALARLKLQRLGVSVASVRTSGLCSVCDQRFYSHRRAMGDLRTAGETRDLRTARGETRDLRAARGETEKQQPLAEHGRFASLIWMQS